MKLKSLRSAVRMLARPASDSRGANARGYTYRWQQYRKRWLEQHPLCGDRLNGSSGEHSRCARDGIVTPATDVDHIERVAGPNDARFWQQENHQSLCHACHSVKTQQEQPGGHVEPSNGEFL